MENVWAVVVSALVSGILATIITIVVNNYQTKLSEKRKVLSIMLSYRYDIANENNVNAMNRIQVVYYGDDEVISAWKDFNDATKDKSKQDTILDKYLLLLENMSHSCGYKNLKWDDIKISYLPTALSKKMIEESLIRSKTAENINNNNGSSGDFNQQAITAFMLEMMKQPNGIENLVKLAEISKKDKK